VLFVSEGSDNARYWIVFAFPELSFQKRSPVGAVPKNPLAPRKFEVEYLTPNSAVEGDDRCLDFVSSRYLL